MKTSILTFPKNFYWGSSTSAHQAEGNNHNDWTEWEKENAVRLAKEAKNRWQGWQVKKFPEMLQSENYVSGQACDHYLRYQEDFNIATLLNHNAHRFSIEWSRIEPKEGKFNEKEIEHYREVLKALKKRGMEPFVTLWHWTNPLWISEIGGWENKKTIDYFQRYVAKLAKKLGSEIKFWLTLNEPTVFLARSYVTGAWPPQKRNYFSFNKVYKNLAEAHVKAYKTIHTVCPNANVGFANNMSFVEPKHRFCLGDQIISWVYRYFGGEKIYKLTAGNHDFIAFQYYFHDVLCLYKAFRYLLSGNPHEVEGEKNKTDLGWHIYPEGIYKVLKRLEKYDKPVYITENGLADRSDKKRKKFINDHLFWVHKAISEGVNVRGYFYWSLLDNFEWSDGFWPRFGLVEVDRTTLKRTIRPSARAYAKICRANAVGSRRMNHEV